MRVEAKVARIGRRAAGMGRPLRHGARLAAACLRWTPVLLAESNFGGCASALRAMPSSRLSRAWSGRVCDDGRWHVLAAWQSTLT
eukprot:132510-Pleurochrysis_carterae.AAC.1